ncbi:MAG TPA: Tex-like N-terminal domain-containing protein [Gemmataceae bacterium]|nr:Tex-like N-terminal domain-containing protein [Gemmataceae bacterium]
MQTPVMSKGVDIASGPKTGSGLKLEQPLDYSRIAQDLQIRKVQVESVVQLLDEGNTVPFITRYRKERTGSLNEEIIRQIQARVAHLRQLAERKQTILKSIEGQGKLTDSLRTAILMADTSKRLEDLYQPYKPKKRTLATIARERGLEPLALAIWNRDPAVLNLNEVLPGMVNPEKELNTPEDVLLGVQHILAELVTDTAEVRAAVRSVLWETGKLCTTKSETVAEGHGLEYKDYFQFTETVRRIPPHRILAINRGEKEGILKARLEWDAAAVRRVALDRLPLMPAPAGAPAQDRPEGPSRGEPGGEQAPASEHPHAEFLKQVVEDALSRLLLPSLEREIRRELTDEAEDHAVAVFARNLRSLLLQRPLRGRRVLAIDPGFRTGCKLAALDEFGTLLEEAVIYPFGKGERGRGKGADRRTPNPAVAASAPDRSASGQPASPPPSRIEYQSVPPLAAVSIAPPVAEFVSAVIAPPAPASDAAPANQADVSGPGAILPEPVHTAGVLCQPAVPPTAENVATALVAPGSPPLIPIVSPEPVAAQPIPSPEPGALPAAATFRQEAKAKLEELLCKHQLNVIAIGNGTACRETEELVSELIAEKFPELAYVIVNEAGASVYSASAIGREEFPSYDATLRGTISIGRRLQDPLSELVKIDPQNIGVGLYQHDIHPHRLKDSLDAVIESCVNHVGVDLNTASVPLLRHVSGLNQLAARELVNYRKQNGPFRTREQLLQVPSIGPARFVQAAGFLKILGGDNPLDRTWVHPESYPVALRLLAELGTQPEVLGETSKAEEFRQKLKGLSLEEWSARLQVGLPTLEDMLEALSRPGRDPRDDLPPPVFKKGILKLEDLQPGMELKGTVLNVVDFGAFIDIGLKDSGLVHISQMANRYIKNPYDVVAVGDVVTVWVLTVDHERRRVSLTMLKPGTERKQPEKGAQAPRPQRGSRPPRGRRPPPAKGQTGAPPAQGQATSPPQRPRQPAAAGTVSSQPATTPSPAPQPSARPRRPARSAPKPKLSKAALEGAAPLRTFGELKAYFEAQQHGQASEPASGEAGTDTAHSSS